MKRKPGLTIKQYLEIADELAIVDHHLRNIFRKIDNVSSIKSKLLKLFNRIIPGSYLFVCIQNELNDEWHKYGQNIDHIRQYGHIYYYLDNRYEQIQKEKNHD